MTKNDYYTILSVKRGATDKEIKQAYRRLARRYHPDVNPGDTTAERKFKEISEAYAVLGNSDNRKKYDQFGHQAFAGGFDSFARGQASRGSQTGNIKDFFNNLGGQGHFTEGVSSLFEDLFGQTKSNPQTAPKRGKDLEQTVEISFEDAVQGTSREVHITRQNGGSEFLRVKIPAGVDTHSRIRLARKGGPGTSGEPPGDLYIVTRVQPHPFFSRDGSDIICEVPVTLAEVLLGAKIDIPTIDGKTSMTLPAGTQNGRTFRLRGKGVSHLKGGGRGDQYVTVNVVLPATLDDRSCELIEEFDRRHPLQPRAQMRW
ncbi:MAG: DnaJ C-terminal domain-containing protein [Candidatus Tectomicrobia bacterium]